MATKISKKGGCQIFCKNGGLAKKEDLVKRGNALVYCHEYKADMAILY